MEPQEDTEKILKNIEDWQQQISQAKEQIDNFLPDNELSFDQLD